MATPASTTPLVSIFMFVRNGARSIRRAVDSILAQTYSNIEFIVQDGASTDGTLEVLRSYGHRLEVVSQPDSGPNEGLWRALSRCTGTFIGSCLADEELLPDAVERAVAHLCSHPQVSAITGDAIITNFDGVTTGFWKSAPFNLVDYLLCDYTPYFCSSFFRRQALLDAGLKSDDWGRNCVEFELWCRLARQGRIAYVPETFAKYASHADQSSNNSRDVAVHFEGRLLQIIEMCSTRGFFGDNPELRALFVWGHARAFINHAIAFKRPEIAASLFAATRRALSPYPPVHIEGRRWEGVEAHERPPAHRTGYLPARLLAMLRHRRREAEVQPLSHFDLPPAVGRRLKARMNIELAFRYESHGRFAEALETWRIVAALEELAPLRGPSPVLATPSYSAAQPPDESPSI